MKDCYYGEITINISIRTHLNKIHCYNAERDAGIRYNSCPCSVDYGLGSVCCRNFNAELQYDKKFNAYLRCEGCLNAIKVTKGD